MNNKMERLYEELKSDLLDYSLLYTINFIIAIIMMIMKSFY